MFQMYNTGDPLRVIPVELCSFYLFTSRLSYSIFENALQLSQSVTTAHSRITTDEYILLDQANPALCINGNRQCCPHLFPLTVTGSHLSLKHEYVPLDMETVQSYPWRAGVDVGFCSSPATKHLIQLITVLTEDHY